MSKTVIKCIGIFIIIIVGMSFVDAGFTEFDPDIWEGEQPELWERVVARGILLFIGMLLISVSLVEILKYYGVNNIIYKSINAFGEYSVKLISNAFCLYLSIVIYIVVLYLPYKLVVWLFT